MSAPKHTKGPWTAKGTVILDPQNNIVAMARQWPRDGTPMSPECEANAKLIAAAPSLLDALQHIKDELEEHLDIEDGPDGTIRPNIFMKLHAVAKQALEGR